MSVRMLRHVHLSGKFNVKPKELTDALDVFSTRSKANVITLTEVSPPGLRAPIAHWAASNHWHVYHPPRAGQNECAVLTREPFVETHAYLLTPLQLRVGRTAPIYLICARLAGGPWFAVWHTPAHTYGWRPGVWATRVYMSALRGLRVARLRLRGHGLVLVADWNVDLHRQAVRDKIGGPYRRLHWAVGDNQAPTLGNRIVDGVLTDLLIVRKSITLSARLGFDHRPILTSYAKRR